MVKRNPKQVGSSLWDCKPQTGLCPNNCNQCFYNRPGAFYVPVNEAIIPTPQEVGNGIVRINCGHDSNIEKDMVIDTASLYPNHFFNTSIANLDFPSPVVLTVNPWEEEKYYHLEDVVGNVNNLMFVRVRASASNMDLVKEAVKEWANEGIPVVLTFMAYYEKEVVDKVCCAAMTKNSRLVGHFSAGTGRMCADMLYMYRVRHVNSYWCPTRELMSYVLGEMKKVVLINSRLVTMCGTLDSNYCRDCRNCETYYWQTIKHIGEKHGH